MRHNDEKGMSEKEMIANAASLIIAGSESTATTLSGFIFHILSNPRCLSILQKEIWERFASSPVMDFAAVAELPYLQACIEETLRLYPPVPSNMPRMVAREGMVIDGQFVQGEVSLLLNALF
jgi:cytochrome P450